MTRRTIKIIRKGKIVEIDNFAPDATLLDYLRLSEGACGTKEGCAEGDCGACTIVLGELKDGKVHYQPINACIQFLAMVDGREVITVEDLKAEDGTPHPVQSAMVKHHASQCGFCTPGFVMSLFSLYHDQNHYKEDTQGTGRAQIVTALAGNLCRCTGYRPIIDAALQACGQLPDDQFTAAANKTARMLAFLQDEAPLFAGDQTQFFAAPHTQGELAALISDHSDAVIIAGATDVGLWVTKGLRKLPKIISVSRVKSLGEITESEKTLEIGAAVTYAAAQEALAKIAPDLAQFINRIGSLQLRASGTIGGNIANGSPIGDMPPLLMALGARLHLNSVRGRRSMKLEDYFLVYGKQARGKDEFVASISVPKLQNDEIFVCYKISKRFDQDISALCGAFLITVRKRIITKARIAFGGMAAIPKLAVKTQIALQDANLDDPQSWPAVAEALEGDFTPIGDMRASAAYRMQTAKALLLKVLHESAGQGAGQLSLYPARRAANAKGI